MSNHIAKSGKNIDSSKSHLVPTSVRKATTFLNDEYLRTCQQRAIILISICAVSAITASEKNHPPHNLKVAVWIFRVEVKNASCSCVACQVGFCNHFLALLLKLCKFSLWVWKCDRPWKRRQHAAKTDLHINSAAVASQGKRRLYKSTTSDGSVGDQNKLRVRQTIIIQRLWSEMSFVWGPK